MQANQAGRFVLGVIVMLVGGFWWLNDTSTVSKVAGAALFVGLGVVVMIPGFLSVNWPWLGAIGGVGVAFMSPVAVVLGVAIALPFTVIVVVRLWVRFQGWVVEESVKRVE